MLKFEILYGGSLVFRIIGGATAGAGFIFWLLQPPFADTATSLGYLAGTLFPGMGLYSIGSVLNVCSRISAKGL